jgi:hypothetical protein
LLPFSAAVRAVQEISPTAEREFALTGTPTGGRPNNARVEKSTHRAHQE